MSAMKKTCLIAMACIAPAAALAHHNPRPAILAFFGDGRPGEDPKSTLATDAAGNLYGTTSGAEGADCRHGCGTVFQLTPPASGQTAWTENVILTFDHDNGAYPQAGVLVDKRGHLFGTTKGGKGHHGLVYELIPPGAGETAWKEKIHVIFDGANGEYPDGALISDNDGNLYGTTSLGGAFGFGTVFELSSPVKGHPKWTYTLLYSFSSTDGAIPLGSLLLDKSGNLYGTTSQGGASNACTAYYANGCGTVFELSPPASGQTSWTETVLTSFNNTDGALPAANLIADSGGHLYGTTSLGGASTQGTVFELTPPAKGQQSWTETVLTSFDYTDGSKPLGGLLADAAGNLFGTTGTGGVGNRQIQPGTVFRLSPPSGGTTDWMLTTLYSLRKNYGVVPVAGLISDNAGNLYGTAEYCGSNITCSRRYNGGSVFELSDTGFVPPQ